MSIQNAKAETLTGAIFAPLSLASSLALVVAFSLLTALAAQIVIPLPLVPLTGQTFAVILTGALLGSRLGALAMILYLVEGASGLPFFAAGGSGVGRLLFGTTSGYLLSFPAAAFVVGLLAERGWDRRFLSSAAMMLIGSAIILAGGFAWLSRFLPLAQAAQVGLLNTLPGEIIKVVLAAAVLPSGWAIMRKVSGPK